MESLETIMTNKLQYLFNGDVHVKQKGNVLIVDVYFMIRLYFIHLY